jgi:hypothetical protein
MCPTIDLPDDLFGDLQRLAIPFVDREPADVIRRLVRVGATAADSASEPLSAHRVRAIASGRSGHPSLPAGELASRGVVRDAAGGGLLASGVTIPNGLRLRLNYRGRLLPAVVRQDRIWIADQPFVSPSAAAIAGAATLGFDNVTLNGWWYWEYEDPAQAGQWRRLMTLRGETEVRRRKRR